MARKSVVAKQIYRKHIALYRHINNSWIFTDLLRPHLQTRAKKLRLSKSNAKKPYKAPKKSGWTTNKRRDKDVGELFQNQHDRGLFETNIVSVVSRVEAFIQDCVAIAVCAHPEKLKLLSDKTGVPVDLVLENEDREDLIQRYVALKCDHLMFAKPKDYLERAAKVLSIQLDPETINEFIEVKASRDIIVHGGGIVNKVYLDKTADSGRAKLGEKLPINREYYIKVVILLKKLSGEIQSKTEAVYK